MGLGLRLRSGTRNDSYLRKRDSVSGVAGVDVKLRWRRPISKGSASSAPTGATGRVKTGESRGVATRPAPQCVVDFP